MRASKQRPNTRPNCARCGKGLRDCGRSAWLATPPTRRHRPPTERVSRNTAKHLSARAPCFQRPSVFPEFGKPDVYNFSTQSVRPDFSRVAERRQAAGAAPKRNNVTMLDLRELLLHSNP